MVQVTPPSDWRSSEPADRTEATDQKASRKRPFKKPIPDPTLPDTQSSISGSVSEGLQEKLQRRADEKAASGDKSDSGGRWQGADEVTSAAEKTEASKKEQGAGKGSLHEKQQSTEPGSDSDSLIAPPKQDPNNSDPVLPGDQWSSAKSRQQKKMLMIFVATAAVLIFGVGAIVFAAMQLGTGGANDNGQKIAESTNPDNSNPGSDEASTNQTGEETTNADSEEKKKPLNPDPTATSAALKSDPENKNHSVGNGSKQLIPAADSPRSENESQRSSDTSNNKNGKDTPKNTPKQNTPKSSDEKNDPLNADSGNREVASITNGTDAATDPDVPFEDNKPDAAVKGIFDDINDFAVFETDAELLRARNQFQENDLAGTYGATRFFVERSLKKMPDPDRALKIRIEAVKFQQTTLLEFLDFFYQGTGVSVAVDVTPIILAGIRLDEKFDLLTSGKTFVEILRMVADQRGLQLIENGNSSLILTIPDRDTLIAKEHPASDLVTSKSELQTLMGLMQQYINKETWSQVGGKGIITANEKNNSIFVEHFGWAQVRVAEILRHMRAAKGLEITSLNPNLSRNSNRLELANAAKEKTITIVESDPISLSRLLANLAKSHNLHVFINWEATGDKLLPSGSLPLSIENETVDQIISELAESMKLQVVWHSANVVELTTELGASSNLTFESYDISKSVQPGSTPERLLAAIKKLLTENKIADFKKAEIGLDPVDKKNSLRCFCLRKHIRTCVASSVISNRNDSGCYKANLCDAYLQPWMIAALIGG